jgi:transposase-like protein
MYLFRAVDDCGATIDFFLSETSRSVTAQPFRHMNANTMCSRSSAAARRMSFTVLLFLTLAARRLAVLYCRHRKIERARRRFGATVEIRVAPGSTLVRTQQHWRARTIHL